MDVDGSKKEENHAAGPKFAVNTLPEGGNMSTIHNQPPANGQKTTADQQNSDEQPAAAEQAGAFINLAEYNNGGYHPGRGPLMRILWYYVSLVVFESGWFPVKAPKRWLLRLFGAKIGKGVVIKPNVRIKYPWRLSIGDYSWIGQEVWVDNLAEVRIGSHTCISQKVYICTGGHRFRNKGFDLIARPIAIGDGSWLGAGVTVLNNVEIHDNVLVSATLKVDENVPNGRILRYIRDK